MLKGGGAAAGWDQARRPGSRETLLLTLDDDILDSLLLGAALATPLTLLAQLG